MQIFSFSMTVALHDWFDHIRSVFYGCYDKDLSYSRIDELGNEIKFDGLSGIVSYLYNFDEELFKRELDDQLKEILLSQNEFVSNYVRLLVEIKKQS